MKFIQKIVLPLALLGAVSIMPATSFASNVAPASFTSVSSVTTNQSSAQPVVLAKIHQIYNKNFPPAAVIAGNDGKNRIANHDRVSAKGNNIMSNNDNHNSVTYSHCTINNIHNTYIFFKIPNKA